VEKKCDRGGVELKEWRSKCDSGGMEQIEWKKESMEEKVWKSERERVEDKWKRKNGRKSVEEKE
jgi:hypothetical protein